MNTGQDSEESDGVIAWGRKGVKTTEKEGKREEMQQEIILPPYDVKMVAKEIKKLSLISPLSQPCQS